jgi:spore germination protein KC
MVADGHPSLELDGKPSTPEQHREENEVKARIQCAVIALLCACLLTGCWNYRDLDNINFVAGIAVDEWEGDGYELTLELINTATIKEGSGEDTLIVSAVGDTIYEAIRNAKKKVFNDLYFGSMRTIIVNEKLARGQCVLDIIDYFVQDTQTRETTVLVISREESAGKLMTAKGLDASNISLEIANIVEENEDIDSRCKSVHLYEAYNYVMAKGLELVLPTFNLVKNDDKEVVEINGIGIFQGDKLIDFLTPEETHYFLIATDSQTRGALSFPMTDTGDLVSLEIVKCNNKPKVHYADGKVSVFVTVDLEYKVVEVPKEIKPVSDKTLEEINKQVERVLADRVVEVFRKTQAYPGLDIYGYGNQLYENQFRLWSGIKDQWGELYKEADYQIRVNATNVNIGVTL